jgi:hypothetical protein
MRPRTGGFGRSRSSKQTPEEGLQMESCPAKEQVGAGGSLMLLISAGKGEERPQKFNVDCYTVFP